MSRYTGKPNHLRKLRRVRQGRHRPGPQNRNQAVTLCLLQGFARLRAPDTTRSFSSQIPFVVTLLGNLRRKRQLAFALRTGFASMVPPRPRARYAIAITRRNPSAHHVRVAHRNGHAMPIITNTRTQQMPAAPSPRFAKKPYGFPPRDATRRGTVPPAISRCNRETGYDTKRDGCTVHHGARNVARPCVPAPKTRHPSLRMCYDPA